MKEKHDLLKYAYDNYPPGTRFIGVGSKMEFTSVGRFEFYDYSGDFCTDINIVSEGRGSVFMNGKWAEIVKDEPLKVKKVAVRVENESQLKSIGEKHNLVYGVRCYSEYGYPKLVRIKDDKATSYTLHGPVEKDAIHDGYTIIDFDFWAAQNNVDVPKLVLKTEDGIEIWDKDVYIFLIHNRADVWSYHGSLKARTTLLSNPKYKAFSTKEAAEKWIEEQKPKEIEVQLFNQFHSAKVSKEWIAIRVGKPDSNTTTMFKPSDLEDMPHAYKFLQK